MTGGTCAGMPGRGRRPAPSPPVPRALRRAVGDPRGPGRRRARRGRPRRSARRRRPAPGCSTPAAAPAGWRSSWPAAATRPWASTSTGTSCPGPAPRHPTSAWIEGDLAALGPTVAAGPFAAAVLAGNVMIFTSPGTEGAGAGRRGPPSRPRRPGRRRVPALGPPEHRRVRRVTPLPPGSSRSPAGRRGTARRSPAPATTSLRSTRRQRRNRPSWDHHTATTAMPAAAASRPTATLASALTEAAAIEPSSRSRTVS